MILPYLESHHRYHFHISVLHSLNYHSTSHLKRVESVGPVLEGDHGKEGENGAEKIVEGVGVLDGWVNVVRENKVTLEKREMRSHQIRLEKEMRSHQSRWKKKR